jgi:hypothetical protein
MLKSKRRKMIWKATGKRHRKADFPPSMNERPLLLSVNRGIPILARERETYNSIQ